MAFRIVEHTIDGQHIRGYPHSTRRRQEDVLRLAIKQYIPNTFDTSKDSNAVTIIATHGLGFPKETYEPLFAALCSRLQATNVSVRGIWIADMVNQNASGTMNEELLGDQFDWFDGARDLLTMVNHFRHEMPRPIIGLGHSFGCAMLAKLSTMHPRLLSTVVFCEPVIFEIFGSPKPNIGLGAMMRRDYWPSRAEAESKLMSSFQRQGWAEDSIRLYLKYGLRSLPTALYDSNSNPELARDGVTLVTTKHQEAWSFGNVNWKEGKDVDELLRRDQTSTDLQCIGSRPQATHALLVDLPSLRPSVLYVFGGSSPISPEAEQDRKMALTGTGIGGSGGVAVGKVKKEIIKGSGHMLPLEENGRKQLVELSALWIADWFKQYLEEERKIADLGSGNSDESGIRASKEYAEALKSFITAPRTVPRPARRSAKDRGKL